MLLFDQIAYGYGYKTIGSISDTLSLSSSTERANITLITGRNGSGKTTFLRTVAGLLPLLKGRIFWQEAPLEEAHLARKICYLGDGLEFFGDLSVSSILESLNGSAGNRDHLLELFALQPRWLWKRLSTGQKQKVRICLILHRLTTCDLIILDEPFSGLDLESRQTAMDLVQLGLLGTNKRLLICLHQDYFPPGWVQNRLHFADRTLVLRV